ncbi:hypothetical protein JMA_02720 [Jeotgalibacillus malaysiensis]|uniref:Uncharacterized protein n=1 Tax=Jeotgalibacillus malaysiensis TaxID=1508404 RepID=A0A0B5ANK7_9BACL|nr:hypothetical protein [Jeotgalibacillus malaysiensis]AJD89589.1 hypothetical protein JMA_02720 [Jeotgalibacillus malaysiensis]
MVKFNRFNIDFDIHKETPYFQVNREQSIRFGMEDLHVAQLREIVETIFQSTDNLRLIFVSAYIKNHQHISSKSKIGKQIRINNWQEHVVKDPALGEGVVYTTIRHLDISDIMNYCIRQLKGYEGAYISFYNDDFLLYVSNDVIDMISHDKERIKHLKRKYVQLYDRYYE